MAYVRDFSMSTVSPQRVQTRGHRRAGMGTDDAYIPIVVAPAEISHPFALMTVCDVQRHLVATGKLPRLGVDGQWGNQSHTALNNFAKQLPLTVARSVMATGSSGLPGFGSREDYKMDGGKIRIPQAYVMALPAKANVVCGGMAAPPTDNRLPPGVAPGDGSNPLPDADKLAPAGGAKSSPPWAIIGVAAGAALLLGVFLLTRKKDAPKLTPKGGAR